MAEYKFSCKVWFTDGSAFWAEKKFKHDNDEEAKKFVRKILIPILIKHDLEQERGVKVKAIRNKMLLRQTYIAVK